MDDDMDDFGDLYGDLEDRVNAGIFLGQQNQYSCLAERNPSNSKPGEFDSISEGHGSDDRIGEANERAVASNWGKESLALGAQKSGNSSASEDDFRIVLNEEDCLKWQPSQRENLGSGGAAVGEGEGEKEDEDSVILYGPACLQKTQKWGDRPLSPTDGRAQGSTRGSAEKGSHHSWYVGSNQGVFSYNGKTSLFGRGVLDHLMMPSSESTASCGLSIPASAQNGYSFILPRNRTIFDINIEAFEQKPWRQPGVDITDYFNFGLDEDSWKSYCQQLDQFSQRVTMFTQFPDYNLSRRNQVLESDLGSPKAISSEAAQWEHREKRFLHMENVERRLTGIQMPKGRAIQVESGVGERIPSADMRRPRHLDSDVVIQIVMDGSMETASIPCEGELKYVEQGHEDCLMLEYQNELNEGMLSLDYDGQGYWEITNPFAQCYSEVVETNLKRAVGKVKDKLDYCKGGSEDSLKVDDSLVEAEIASGVGVQVTAETNLKGAPDEVKDKLNCSKGESEDSLRVDDSLMEAEIASGVGVQVMAETKLKGAADEIIDKLDYSKGESDDSLRVDDSLMEAEIASGIGVQVMEETILKGAADEVKDELDYSMGESEDSLRVDDSLMEPEITSGVGFQLMEETILEGAADEVKDELDYSKGESEDSLRVDDSLMEAEIASGVGVQVMQSLSSHDLHSHSEASKDDGLKKIHAAIRKTYLDSVTGMQESVRSDCYLSNDSGINATKTEIEDIKGNTCGCRLSPEVYKGCSRSGHNVMSELNRPAENEQASIRSPKKSQNDVDPFEVSYGIKEGKCDHGADMSGHLSSNKETKTSVSYKSRKYAEKHASKKNSAKSSHKGDHDSHPRINRDKRDFFEQRAAGGDSAIKHHECRSGEWHCDDRGERVVHHKHSDESISECGSIFLGEDSSMRHKKEREKEHLIRTDAVNYEHRYREKHVKEMHRRHIAKCNREEGIFDHSVHGAAACSGREERTPERRVKYDRSLCFDLHGSNKYIEYNAKRLRHLDGRLLDPQTYEHYFEYERSSLRNHLRQSCRSHEKSVGHRKHFAIGEIESRLEKYECCFVPGSKDFHPSSYENDNKFHDDEHTTEERGTYVDDIVWEKRYGRLAKPRPDTDDNISFKHGDHDLTSREEAFLCERSSRNEKSLVKQHLVGGRKFSDDCRLSHARKEVVNEITQRSSASDAREHGKFVLHTFDKGRHELATLGRREAVNMHLNGLKRKFHKRGNEVTVASEIDRVVIETIDEEQKDSRCIEDHLEVPLHVPKSEGTHNRPTSLKERVTELKSEHSDDHFLDKCEDKHPISQTNDDDEIEEGQLIEESDDQHVGSMTEDSTMDNKILGGYDSNRILQTLAKMEKRRERFKEPLAVKQGPEKTLKQGPEKTLKPQPEVATVPEEPKQQRPARKRQWGGIL